MPDDKVFAWIDKLARVIPIAGIMLLLSLSVMASCVFGIRGLAATLAMLAAFVVWCSVMTWLLSFVRPAPECAGVGDDVEMRTAGP